MRANRALALSFILILFLTPLLEGCRPRPAAPAAATPAAPITQPAQAATVAAVATAAPARPPTAVPSPTPTRVPLPPVIVEVTPEPGEEQKVDAPLVISFDQPMDAASTTQAFSIEPQAPGKVKVDGRQLTFTPSEPFKRSAEYRVRVDAGAAAASGLKLQQAVSFKVTTVGFLQVAGSQPADHAAGVPVDTKIVVSFNRPVVPLTGVQGQAGFPQPLVITPTVDGKGEWLSTSIYQYTPSSGLAASTQYSVTVKSGLADTTGGVLSKSYSFTFGTDFPQVVRWTPENANALKVDEAITATFSMPMDRASTEAAFSLAGPDKAPAGGAFSWNDAGTQMGFKPAGRLAFGTKYVATVGQAARPARGQGHLPSDYTQTFTTIPLPTVVSTTPRQGDQRADPYGSVQLKFGAAMDESTFITGTYTVLPKPTKVYTNYNEWDNSLYLNFERLPATAYTITLSAALADPYGNKLGQDYALHFRTADFPPSLQIQSPGYVGTYNAYTTTEAILSYLNVPSVDFKLYRVSVADFTGLTVGNYWEAVQRYIPQESALVHQWTVDTKAARNQSGILREKLVDQDGKTLPPGIYLLTATPRGTTPAGAPTIYKTQIGQLLLARTDLNVTLKSSGSSVLAWVTDLKTGQPVSGVKVRFVDGGKTDLSATTGADGVAEVTFPAPRQPYDALLALATGPGGRMGVASNNWESGIASWDFNVGGGSGASTYNGYVYTDRPIYRPGQTVYWKGIVRRDDDALYSLPPAGTPVTVTINDDQGKKLFEQRLALNATGSIDGKLDLGAEVSLGNYFVQMQLTKELGYGVGFQVAEYRKPEYELSATTDRPEYMQGDRITVNVQANYYFGGPVQNAKVQWSLRSSDFSFRYQPPSGGQLQPWYYSFGDWDWYDFERTRTFGQPLGQGQGRTDAAGKFSFTVPADIARFVQSQRFTIDVTVQDVNNQSVSGQASAVVHKGDFYIGLHPESYTAEAGKENRVDVLTVDTKSKPVPDTQVTVVANEFKWYSVRVQDVDGRYYWSSKPQKTPVYTQTVTTRPDGTAVFTWQPPGGGEYKIEATSRDGAGRKIFSAAFVWVSSSSDYVSWRQDNNDRIQVVADKDEYRAGDTAQLLVASPYQNSVKALVTVERDHVLSHQVIDLKDNSQLIPVPITAQYAPNVYVSVMLIQGMRGNAAPSFKMGLARLKVSIADKQLQVTLTPDRAKVAPRDTVNWTVEVRDAAGAPAANADVSLALVDKAVLALADDQSGKLVDRFYAQRALGVRTASGLAVNIDRLVTQVAKAGKGGGGGGPGGITTVRSNFPDVAYWNAAVTTGPDGKAQIKVTLPDNLTTWVMDGRAVTAGTLVGQNTAEVVATKDLLIRPVLPRFFIQGDQAEIAAIIQNNTAQPLEVTIDMQATGLQPAKASTQPAKATVAAGGNYKAVWSVTVQPGQGEPAFLDQAKVLFHASGGTLSDAVETTLPVYHYTTPEVTGTAGQVAVGESRLELVRFPAGADPTRGELQVNLEPSLAAGMTGGLSYLEHYPYECLEQTVSRFLPNILTYSTLKTLGISRPDLQEKLPQQVGVALQRIYSQQHVDGGWGWWPQDSSSPFLTSYVVFGLAKAKTAGFTVDTAVLQRGIRYLRDNLKSPANLKDYELNEQAFMVYALAVAGAPEPNRAGALFEARVHLSTYAKGYLALALNLINDNAGKDRIKTLLADFTGTAVVSATAAHWEEGWTDFWNMNTDTRTTSIIVDVLATVDPQNNLAPNAVRWLMTARKGDRWETTQENAWAIMALTDWMAATGELQGSYGWQARLNGSALGSGTVTPATVGDVVQLRADVSKLLIDQTNGLTIERTASADQTGKGQLYYTAYLKSYLPVEKLEAQSRGVSVSRTYQMAGCAGTLFDANGNPVDANGKPLTAAQQAAACPAITAAKVGDIVNVKVTIVVPNSLYYLIVEDPLPAGLEPVDASLKTTSRNAQGPNVKQAGRTGNQTAKYWYPYWWWTPTHIDLRDEKAVMFATSMTPGTYEFNYQAQVTLPGRYLVLPPTAYQMYFPEVEGRGAGSVFTVTEP